MFLINTYSEQTVTGHDLNNKLWQHYGLLSFVIASKHVIDNCKYFPISHMRYVSREVLMNSITCFKACV